MAGSYEQTIIVGNVGNIDKLKYTASGVAVVNFNVAVNAYWTDSQTNEKREKTNWYRVVAWRGLAETCARFLTKGMSVMVVGTVEASAYMGKDGQPRSSLELTAQNVQFLTRVDGGGGAYTQGNAPAQGNDIPF